METSKDKEKEESHSEEDVNIEEERRLDEGGEEEKRWINVVVISDTHTNHPKIVLPQGDVLVHCGDFCRRSTLQQVSVFNDWLGTTQFPIKLLIGGNHEVVLDSMRDNPQKIQGLLSNAIYLQDSEVTLFDGKLRVYGSPWVARNKYLLHPSTKGISSFIGFGLGFALPEDETLLEKRKAIPTGVDWLITHSPPFGILDYAITNTGCKMLRDEVQSRIKPQVHMFGHNHFGFGTHQTKDTLFINGALENGSNWARPIKFKYCLDTKEAVILSYDPPPS